MNAPNLLILGARSDIARAIAQEYAAHGYSLMLAARNAAALATDAEDYRIRHNVNVSLHEWDALACEAAADFYAALPARPDVVICVAGHLGDQTAAQSDWQSCERILQTNYVGLVAILNIIADDFADRGSGCMIGLSSVAGDRGRQSNYLYGSAKAGFTAYLSGLRNRLHPHGVQVLTVKPGFVNTTMTQSMELPALLTASPQQVARDIYKAQGKGKDLRYTAWYWRWIMLVIRSIPETIFKRLSL